MLAAGERLRLEGKGLFFYLTPQAFRPASATGDLVTRRVYPEQENDRLLALYGACTAEEVDDAEIYVEEPDPVIYGTFDGPQMVAYASHRYWVDVLADIGVLVHPAYRSRGLGKAVVSALCAWCLDNDIVPMYRVNDDHLHSRRIPVALGFRQMATVEVLQVDLTLSEQLADQGPTQTEPTST
jgi:GNAT superfamily N-acetyltransferase